MSKVEIQMKYQLLGWPLNQHLLRPAYSNKKIKLDVSNFTIKEIHVFDQQDELLSFNV